MSNEHHTHTEGEYIPETYIPHAVSHGTKSLWRTFWVLAFVTVIDFAIYFMAPASMLRNMVFIALGIFKAVLIVGIFMHLNYETKFLRWMIILPAIIFLSYFVWLLMLEGDYVSMSKYF
jgi:cytochrome c oxidase subunit IV